MAEGRPSKRLKTSSETQNNGHGNLNEDVASVSTSLPDEVVSSSVKDVLDKEARVGISTFIGQQQTTITGIFKQRYTDFLVNEVLPDGTVLHLQKTTYDGVDQSSKASKAESSAVTDEKANGRKPQPTSTNEQESPEKATISDEDRAQLIKYLGESAVNDVLALWTSITENPKKRSRDHPLVNTPFTSDRMVRTEIHQAIRRIFHSRIDSSTNKDGILVLSAANPNFRNNHGSRVGKLSWIERGGEHCHFTLYKEMKDTMESISFLAHLIKKNPRDFQFAGTKDRRAATVQRVSVWRVEAERLAALNRNAAMKNATVGDFEYHSSGLQLGDLAGNEFTITVRDVRLSDGSNDPTTIHSILQPSLASLHTNGFLNYFGLQRFGTFAIGSDVIGLQLLKGDFEGACNSILDYNASALSEDESSNSVGREDRGRAQAIKIFRETNSIRESLEIMPKRLSAETAVIRALGKDASNYLGALLTLQRNMRQMYVHAYQSLVWNKAASNRWLLYGGKVVEGDLVLVSEHKDKEMTESSANDAIDPEGEVIIHASGADRARGGASDDVFERARALTAAEAESGRYSIFDIVLPTPGFDIIYPGNDSGDKFYKEIMGQDGLDPYDMRRKQKDFSLSGSYRKVVTRIGAGFDMQMHTYVREDEQFVETDREKLFGKRAEKEANGTAAERDSSAESQQTKTAAVVKLQLGTSQYATMALRELSRSGMQEYKPGFTGGR